MSSTKKAKLHVLPPLLKTVFTNSHGSFRASSLLSLALVSSFVLAGCKTTFRQASGTAASSSTTSTTTAAAAASGAPVVTVANQTGTWGTVFSYTPTLAGDAITSCALTSGTLPTGLSFNTTTCEISGTPTTTLVGPVNSFTITATNAVASTLSDSFTITIPLSALTYSTSPAAYTVNTAITANTKTLTNFGGTATYSVSPALPTGLSLDASTGAISGTPTSITASASYTVTARDSGNANNATNEIATVALTIAINDAAPILAVANQTGTWGTAFSYTLTNTGGTIVSCALGSGTLPTGLSINTTTCAITGTPTVSLTSSNSYTITATNTGGSTTSSAFTITIAVPVLSYDSSSVSYPKNTAITANAATLTNYSAVKAFSVSPALPTGLSIHATTGAISGTPTVITAAANYTVTVRDVGTNVIDTEVLSITVPDAAATLSISSPNSGTSYSSSTQSQTLSGVCSTNATNLAADDDGVALVFSDSDCSDGTWALNARTVALGANVFSVTAENATGSSVSDTMTITYGPGPDMAITTNNAVGFTQTAAALTLNGTCSTTAVTLTASTGAFIDSDCSDGTWQLSVTLTDGVTNTISVTGATAGGFTTTKTIPVSYCSALTAAGTTGNAYSGGAGTVGSPYLITTVAGLNDVRNNLSAYYRLDADLDMVCVDWTPIGSSGATAFTGTFDGNSKTISNLFFNNGATSEVGLFGYVTGGTINSLTLTSATIIGDGSVGALVGSIAPAATVAITDITVSGKVTGNNGTGLVVGQEAGGASSSTLTRLVSSGSVSSGAGGTAGGVFGLLAGTLVDSHSSATVSQQAATTGTVGGLGGSHSGTITGSYATGIVTGTDGSTGGLMGTCGAGSTTFRSYATGAVIGDTGYVGGACGSMGMMASIGEVYATGSVTATNVGGATGYVGGLVGSGQMMSFVDLSYATGNVSGGAYSGGLIGSNSNATISNSYSNGNVSGGIDVGGLIGNISGGTVSLSYASGTVAGSGNIGNFIGNGSTPTVTNAYARNTTANFLGDLGANGGLNGGSANYSDATLANLKKEATFVGFDFSSIWAIVEDTSVPTLRAAVAPSLTVSNQTGTWGTAFSYTPTNSGSAIRNCVVASGTLPVTLNITRTTCEISGTPTAALTSSNTFTVTATNSAGSTTSSSFTITVPAPVVSTSSVSASYYQNVAMTSITSSISNFGGVPTYSIAPALPTGMSLNTSTGTISGTPTALTASTAYVLTVVDANALTVGTANLTFATVVPPPNLSVSNQTGTWGTAFSYTPANTGSAIQAGGCTLTGGNTLPTGLSLNANTCEISGVPTASKTSSNSYTLTATNGTTSSTSSSFTITVPAPALSYTFPNSSYTNFNMIMPTNTALVSNYGGVTSFSVAPPLPNGVTIDANTGEITGTPVGAMPGMVGYTVFLQDGSSNPITDTMIFITIN